MLIATLRFEFGKSVLEGDDLQKKCKSMLKMLNLSLHLHQTQVIRMLIEFSVSNFLSFRDRQTLSMVAVPRLGKRINTFIPDVDGESFPALLKVIAIYGPNASGKSSLIQALDVVRNLARTDRDAEHPLKAKSFRFDKSLSDKPSTFELNFIADRVRYYFLVSLTSDRIIKEELISYPKGKETPLYRREFINKTYQYEFGEALEGSDAIKDVWKDLTNQKSLYITQATTNSSESYTQLRKPYDWLRRGITSIDQDSMLGWSKGTRAVLRTLPKQTKTVASFLAEIDIPVTKIQVDILEGGPTGKILETEELKHFDKSSRTTLTHSSRLGDADFDFEEESGGTKNLIGFWLPWTGLGRTTHVLAIDELDSSLHPKIVESIVRKHLSAEVPSQLIFTTHDTHLMNAKLIRRDQFWITERDSNAATRLYSIYDFEGREGEDVEKRYFEGRYRGLPLIKD